MPRRCKAFRTRGDEPRGDEPRGVEPRRVEPRGVEQVARGSSEEVSIVGGSVSLFGMWFGMRFWLEISLRSTLEHRSPGSLWIRAGEKDRFERRNRLPDTHRGGAEIFCRFLT
jgi:hypothetical protein